MYTITARFEDEFGKRKTYGQFEFGLQADSALKNSGFSNNGRRHGGTWTKTVAGREVLAHVGMIQSNADAPAKIEDLPGFEK